MIGYILMGIATILTLRELFKTYQCLEHKDYIYGSEEHTIEHFLYLFAYSFTLAVTWASIFGYIQNGYMMFFWGVSTILLLVHIRKERKTHTKKD